jgi:hypothetical protein
MHLPKICRRAFAHATLALGITAAATVLVTAQTPQSVPGPEKPVTLVAVSALEPLLPAPVDWLKIRSGTNRVELSPGCDYAFAEGVFMNEAMKVRITVADTGLHPESLAVFASLVVTFPDGYEGKIPPATTITRLQFKDAPAAARWDAGQNDGEFVVLLRGRFVAKAEGTVDSLDTLKALVGQIDFTRLSALK